MCLLICFEGYFNSNFFTLPPPMCSSYFVCSCLSDKNNGSRFRLSLKSLYFGKSIHILSTYYADYMVLICIAAKHAIICTYTYILMYFIHLKVEEYIYVSVNVRFICLSKYIKARNISSVA